MSNLSENQVHDGRIVVQEALKIQLPWMIATLAGGLFGIGILSSHANHGWMTLIFFLFVGTGLVLATVKQHSDPTSVGHLLLLGIPGGVTMCLVIAFGWHGTDGAFRTAMAVGGTVAITAALAFIGTYAWRYLNVILGVCAVLWVALVFHSSNVIHNPVLASQWAGQATFFGFVLVMFKCAGKPWASTTKVALVFYTAVFAFYAGFLGPL